MDLACVNGSTSYMRSLSHYVQYRESQQLIALSHSHIAVLPAASVYSYSASVVLKRVYASQVRSAADNLCATLKNPPF